MLSDTQKKALKEAIDKALKEVFGDKADVNGRLTIPIQNSKAMGINYDLKLEGKDNLMNGGK